MTLTYNPPRCRDLGCVPPLNKTTFRFFQTLSCQIFEKFYVKKESFNGALLIEKLQHQKCKVYIPLNFRVQVRVRRQSPPQESRVGLKWQELIKRLNYKYLN